MFQHRYGRRLPPMFTMGFNPFEYGLQQLPLKTPLLNNFFNQIPPVQAKAQGTPRPQGQHFQIDNPFLSSFMNVNQPVQGQMNPFHNDFFGPHQGLAKPKQSYPPFHHQPIQGGSHQQTYPSPMSGHLGLHKIGGGIGKAISFYNQVSPMWKVIGGFLK